MSIRHWPITERPRERLIEFGPRVLSDGELLAILLGSGNRGFSAVDVARRLILEFGSLKAFLAADRRRCLGQPGIGPARYASLQAALEIARRHYGKALKSSSALRAPAETRAFLLTHLRDKPHEVFCCLYLDAQHRLIAYEELFRGTTDGTTIHPKEVVRQALLHNATAVIFAHNHPSGSAEPSHADQLVTRRLKEALTLVEVKVIDHIVVGEARCVSFAERGLL